jgi:hypothetical protein
VAVNLHGRIKLHLVYLVAMTFRIMYEDFKLMRLMTTICPHEDQNQRPVSFIICFKVNMVALNCQLFKQHYTKQDYRNICLGIVKQSDEQPEMCRGIRVNMTHRSLNQQNECIRSSRG